ncbi:hypothetical protein LAZ67_X001143 [Cordylochernes scorpioides]|uniref:Uncharacterized protein n=1 Tax=Cordylochernes scorpioides TaxID=51811 RepID=A0ABY6LS66_9ARAC|nr:hypothetical protein LAZ67_X001143 [Cordylochernes scorpioides]
MSRMEGELTSPPHISEPRVGVETSTKRGLDTFHTCSSQLSAFVEEAEIMETGRAKTTPGSQTVCSGPQTKRTSQAWSLEMMESCLPWHRVQVTTQCPAGISRNETSREIRKLRSKVSKEDSRSVEMTATGDSESTYDSRSTALYLIDFIQVVTECFSAVVCLIATPGGVFGVGLLKGLFCLLEVHSDTYETNINLVKASLEPSPQKTTRRLSQELKRTITFIQRLLKVLGYKPYISKLINALHEDDWD